LQQQEIVLARSYLEEGFLDSELMAVMAAESSAGESVEMSYEALLELEENIGEVKQCGLDAVMLSVLPMVRYKEGLWSTSPQSCVVCMNEFTVDNDLTQLPCHHHFHKDCAKLWLLMSATCPICRESAFVGAVE
jgi:hypothetical protein